MCETCIHNFFSFPQILFKHFHQQQFCTLSKRKVERNVRFAKEKFAGKWTESTYNIFE